ncbi:hypothetical protein OJ998_24010 [Solirubrobacter taibaiensis]|nr:hypothetical protein [Solirubrobacter taibaiensis]
MANDRPSAWQDVNASAFTQCGALAGVLAVDVVRHGVSRTFDSYYAD